MQVARYDYRQQFDHCIDDVAGRFRGMLLDGSYVLTAEVAAFERAYAEYVGARHAVGVNCGTDAITTAISVLELPEDAEVITQANTFNATVTGIRNAGARPVLVDADPSTFLIDTTQIEARITPRTAVLMPVHFYGKPTPMEPLTEIAAKHGLTIVEDAAQAHGARLNGRHVGYGGRIACYSFHPSKNLAAAGDAGAVTTSDDLIEARLRRARNLGQEQQNQHVARGLNSKLDSLQAVVLSAKLPLLDSWNQSRRRIAARYHEGLAGLPLTFQATSPVEEHAYHLFQVRTDPRDALLNHLRGAGIDAVIRYPTPIHLQPAFADLGWRRGQFPVAEALADELLCLPIRANMPDAEIDYVVETTRTFFG